MYDFAKHQRKVKACEMVSRLLRPYYPDGLLWETFGMRLLVHWGSTHCIGDVHEVAQLSEEKLALLLSVWFERYEQWRAIRDQGEANNGTETNRIH